MVGLLRHGIATHLRVYEPRDRFQISRLYSEAVSGSWESERQRNCSGSSRIDSETTDGQESSRKVDINSHTDTKTALTTGDNGQIGSMSHATTRFRDINLTRSVYILTHTVSDAVTRGICGHEASSFQQHRHESPEGARCFVSVNFQFTKRECLNASSYT
jgi:hypothetical protein